METPLFAAEAAENWQHLTRWERAEIGRKLRRLGWTYGEIMDVIPVGKGTLAGWCREIRLSEEQIEAIKARIPSQKGVPKDTNWKRRLEIEGIREQAKAEVPGLISDPFWVAGTVLYWGEGAKTRNHLALANADPRALRLFVAWVRQYIDSAARFSAQLHIHEGNDDNQARIYWKEATGLKDLTFYKTFVKPRGTGHRKNHLVYGVCRLVVKRPSDHWNRVMVWVEAVAEQLGPKAIL